MTDEEYLNKTFTELRERFPALIIVAAQDITEDGATTYSRVECPVELFNAIVLDLIQRSLSLQSDDNVRLN